MPLLSLRGAHITQMFSTRVYLQGGRHEISTIHYERSCDRLGVI